MKTFEEINNCLLGKAIIHYGVRSVETLLRENSASVSDDFLGFVDFYYGVSDIISKNCIVIDFGCGLGFQHLFFDKQIGYIGIDAFDWKRNNTVLDKAKNYCFLMESISDFIGKYQSKDNGLEFLLDVLKDNSCSIDLSDGDIEVIALCNKVPSQDSRRLINNTFLNVFNYY